MSKIAAIWARVSSPGQTSLPDQVARAKEQLEPLINLQNSIIEDIDRLKKAGINIFLIGESLLAAKDTGQKLKNLLGRG